ncbi:MAG: tRNA pseudouridine(38-40) synthase TruA [Bacteroidetes bacterium GWF2_49_14]|nr:MAG: tRNA pseudouridine(38-40) synthase TruA [Bacteroidetes bacterium GWF2_49_14]HBB92362.1 tRNA pseudouridine(38-40) synthase TruA [Bacteroidales bacterium]
MLTSEAPKYRYFIELAFDGTGYSGWQVQPGNPTVQEYLNKSLSTLLKESVNLTGCGRTDAGVHASHFVAHFDTLDAVPDTDQLVYRLRRFLNSTVRIDRIVQVKSDLHARFNASSRTYHYLIDTQGGPFHSSFSWKLAHALDLKSMNAGAHFLIGKQDFTSLSKLHTDVKTNFCTVTEAAWSEISGFLVFRIRADRFLRNMVRAAVGTLVEVGRGRIEPARVKAILEEKNRSSAGISVPACGLFLTQVDYPAELFATEPVSPFPNLIRLG